jgi:hypothetical protein
MYLRVQAVKASGLVPYSTPFPTFTPSLAKLKAIPERENEKKARRSGCQLCLCIRYTHGS